MIEINTSMENLIQSDLGEAKRIGRRLFWLCPFHEDRHPSLTITPDGTHWKCFGCDKSGDAIQWVRERRGLSFREAVFLLKGQLSDFSLTATRKPASHRVPKSASPPSEEWIINAAAVVAECAERLAAPSGDRARQWLRTRGLTDDTIIRWQLGYNPRHRTVRGLYLRHGITIPWSDEGSVRGVKVRQPVSKPKYVWVGGSRRRGLFLGNEIRIGIPSLVVEGEFDALLGCQEIGDLVNVVTLGSASTIPDQQTVLQLLVSPIILLSYDADDAGQKGLGRWEGFSARLRVCKLPKSKDLTEFHILGGDLRVWIRSQLRANHASPTRHPTLTDNALADNVLRVGLGTRHYPTPDTSVAAPSTGFKEEVPC